MSSQRISRTGFALLGVTAVAAAWFTLVGSNPGRAGQPPVGAAQPAPRAKLEDRPADRKAVRKALAEFAAAFGKGDAKAVGALFTAEGEYISDDGTTYRGRATLEKDYAKFFKNNPGNSLEVEVESVRFPSRDNAVVEGHFKLRMGKTKELVVSRCAFLYTREEGRWLVAIARELPGDGLTLRDLEWLIGAWEVKREGTIVTSRYEWTKNKTFIRCRLSITREGKTLTAMQMIGKMPSTGGLHTWTFEDAGGIGDSDITRDGKKWYLAARGSTADGRVVTATNILTPVDADSFLWQSVERTADGKELPDLAPVKVIRVKSK